VLELAAGGTACVTEGTWLRQCAWPGERVRPSLGHQPPLCPPALNTRGEMALLASPGHVLLAADVPSGLCDAYPPLTVG